MARPRKPSHLLELSGSFRVYPHWRRQRENEPVLAEPLPAQPPSHLPKSVRAAWRDLVPLIPVGVAGVSDTVAVEQAAALFAVFRADPMGFTATQHAELRRACTVLGIGVASR